MATNPDNQRRRGDDGRYVSKCSDEVTERVCLGIRAGVSLETAAQFAEIDESTLTRWKQRVRAGEGTLAERRFVAAVAQEIASFKVTQAALITRPDTPPHVRMEYLGRRWPKEFGPVQRVDQRVVGTVEHEHTGEVRVIRGDLSAYSDQELEQLRALLQKGLDAATENAPPGELLQLPPGRTAASPG